MPLGLIYKHVRKAGPFLNGELSAGQIGVDTTNGILYFSKEGTTVTKHRPLSDAEFTSIGTAIQSSEKGAVNGVATLDAGGKLTTSQIPVLAITSTQVAVSQVAQLALTTQEGDVVVRSDEGGKAYIRNSGVTGTMSDYTLISGPDASGVTTFNGRTGTVVPASGDYTTTLVTRTDGAGGVSGITAEAAIGNLKTLIDGKAASSHTHSAADIASGDLAALRMQTNLVAALNATTGTVTNANLVIDGGTL